jgi:ATP/maltotriose-dependent transcriptional regulator MalT
MLSKLPGREKEVIKVIAGGLSNREISDKLFISESTVENHIHNIYEKLGLTNRAQAVAHAYQTRMVLVDGILEK